MDRLAPSRRPVGRNAGTQRWTDLLFAHYEVEPDAVRALLPRGLELDLFEGRAFVGPAATAEVPLETLEVVLTEDGVEIARTATGMSLDETRTNIAWLA